MEETKYYAHLCPCGNKIEVKIHHKWGKVPKVCKSGHIGFLKQEKINTRVASGWRLYEEKNYLCECGCNQNIELKEYHKQQGVPRYISGHNDSEITEEGKKRLSEQRKGILRTEEVKKKISEATKFAMQNPEVRKKISTKARENFYRNIFLSSKYKERITPLFTLEEYEGSTRRNKYNFKCLHCNDTFESHIADSRIPRCFNCYPVLMNYTSKYEEEIHNWLSSLTIQDIQRGNKSLIYPYQLDLFLPEHKLAIEFNGLYWHSEIGGNKDKNYHLNKTNLCKDKGIQLIHVFEDEWIEKQEIVKSIIKNKLGLTDRKIYARNCEIREVNNQDAQKFLFDNHLQEPTVNKNFGLFYKDELVYLIVVGKSRFDKNHTYELIRSCPKINTNVVGGFSKLFNYIITLCNGSVVSYVDKRYFDGKGYKNWKLLHETQPNYYYMKDYLNRESRIKYQKHKIVENEDDKKLTEWELMQLKGFDRIWDCGNLVYSFKS